MIGQAVGKGGKPKLVQQLISPWACLIGIGTQRQLQADVLRHGQRGQQGIGLIDHADPGLAQGHAAAFGQGSLGRLARRNVMPVDVMRRTPVEDRV